MELTHHGSNSFYPEMEEMLVWRWTHSPYDPRWSAVAGGAIDAVEFGCFGHRPEALLTPTPPHLPMDLGTLTPPTRLAPPSGPCVGWWGEEGWGVPQTPTPLLPQAYWATPSEGDSLSTGESVSPPASDAGAAPCSDSSPEPSVGEPDSFEDSLPTPTPFASRDPPGARQMNGGVVGCEEEGGLHPCIRVWGECKYGETCVFAQTPREHCVFCLRRAVHKKCDGISPPDLPALPDEVAARVADHALERQKHQKERKAKRRATKRREARIQARAEKRNQKLADSTPALGPVPERRHSI